MRTRMTWLLTLLLPVSVGAADLFYLVDAARGVTNGPFSLLDQDEITIATNRFRVVRADPAFDLREAIIADFEVRQEAPEKALRKAWASVTVPSNHPLPELVFFNVASNPVVTLHLRRVSLADTIKYLCEIADLRVTRQRRLFKACDSEFLIIEPHEVQDVTETRVYRMDAGLHDSLLVQYKSIALWLVQMGASISEQDVMARYERDQQRLILRAPIEFHHRLQLSW